MPGFVGGVEIPELLKPPPGDKDGGPADEANPAEETAPAPEDERPAGAGVLRRLPRRLLPRLGGYTNPLLLLAAALLVVIARSSATGSRSASAG